MATPDKRTELDHCAATCRQCYTTCQRVVTEAHPAASTQLHMLLLSCADAHVPDLRPTLHHPAEACWQADHGTMREPAALLRDCAHQCRELSPDLTPTTVTPPAPAIHR